MNEKFCNILVVHEAQLGSSKCFCRDHKCDQSNWAVRFGGTYTKIGKMPSYSPDTLLVPLTGFTSITWSMILPSTFLGLQGHTWSLSCNPTGDIACEVLELDYVALSSARLSNYARSEEIHNLSANQLPQYYQPLQVPSIAWTALVTWYINCKQAHLKHCKTFDSSL